MSQRIFRGTGLAVGRCIPLEGRRLEPRCRQVLPSRGSCGSPWGWRHEDLGSGTGL